MKSKILLLPLLAGLLLAACQKGDEPQPALPLTQLAQQNLLNKYPAAQNISWQTKGDYVVATFTLSPEATANKTTGGTLAAWFDTTGAWRMTETDIPFGALPEAVRTAFHNSEYAQWTLDDVDELDRDGVEKIYVIEVKNALNGIEVDLYYSADGVLIKTMLDSGPDYDYSDYIPASEGALPGSSSTWQQYLAANWPNARITGIDYEMGEIEVDIIDANRVLRELTFNASGTWLRTKTEIYSLTEVPTAVRQALESSQYSGYYIDDIDHYQTSADGEYYLFDLESAQGNVEYVNVKIRISPTGVITPHTSDIPTAPNNGTAATAGIEAFIQQKYAGARVVKIDCDDRLIEVDIFHENRKKEVCFNLQGNWVYSNWEVYPNELPPAVANAKNSHAEFANWWIDGAEYYDTASNGEYWELDLEGPSGDVEMYVRKDGTIIAIDR